MIKPNELRDLDLHTTNGWEWFDGSLDFLFNSKTQELFSHSEVDGSTEIICRIKDVEQLKEVVYLTFGAELC